jgi:ribose-phosphate pyrophosphokinase
MMDALRRASADRITAVIPYYGYARQEKKDRPREAITAKLIADIMTTAGAGRVIALDLHADAIQGFFNIPVDHLTAISIFADYIRKQNLKDMIIVSPDEGRVKQARKLVRMLGAPLAVGYKHHPEKEVTEITDIAGDVRGKTPVIIEDMITTGGSIVECVNALIKNGANHEVHVCATHGVLVGPALERLQNHEAIAEVVVSDSIPLPESSRRPKIKQVSIAPLLAEAIHRVNQDMSVTSLFD